jgi:addiction module HigA family antidote
MTATINAAPMMHSPPHPGEILRELYLAPMHVTVIAAAKALGVTSKHGSGIVNGHVRITADMAIRLAAALDTEAQLWVNLQAQRDLWVASQKKPPNVKPLRQPVVNAQSGEAKAVIQDVAS